VSNGEVSETAESGVEPSTVERVRELERFALSRLPSMQLADGLFCHEVRAEDGCRPHGRSLRYTICVLIGLLRAEEHGIEHPFHAGALRTRILSELGAEGLTPGDFGLALWAESRSDGGAAEEIVGALQRSLGGRNALDALVGMELAWIVIGLAESEARRESETGEGVLTAARSQLLERGGSQSGLLLHAARGPRRRFPNFATQIYGVLALSLLARLRDDGEAREAARAVGDRLLGLQLPDGGWPWIFDAQRGTIVEPYELYSVHQDAMAPMGMHALSEATGDERYRAAATYGLGWVFGRNELGAQMLDREVGMLYRSIRRRDVAGRAYLYGRTAASYVKPPRLKDARSMLEVNRSDRPYHLGWILEAWAGKEELAALDRTG
jgi:hypothetical protein